MYGNQCWLWEWVHKGAILSEDDLQSGIRAGEVFIIGLFEKLLDEKYKKLLKANNKDVFDFSKTTTLPISKEIAIAYIPNEENCPGLLTC